MNDDESSKIYVQFRELAVQRPRQARVMFCELLDTDSPLIASLLEKVSIAGDGRLRQLIANAVRPRADKAKLIPHLIKWLEVETDEFASAAVRGALEGVNVARHSPDPLRDHPDLIKTYRYVSERLCHRVRNGLQGPLKELRILREHISMLAGNEHRNDLEAVVERLDEEFRNVSHIVGFDEDDRYFEMRPILLCIWLENMNRKYSQHWSQVALQFEGHTSPNDVKVIACDYLLETVFWNLWKNAEQEASNGVCIITVRLSHSSGRIHLLLIDSGKGFSPEAQSIVFQERYPPKGWTHGRGLLEVQDAIARLGGTAELVQFNGQEFRIKLTFPLEYP